MYAVPPVPTVSFTCLGTIVVARQTRRTHTPIILNEHANIATFEGSRRGKLRRDNFSILFYVSNISGLTFGVYLVATYLMYRILVLYCLFNLILFWITTPSRRRLWTENTWNSRPVVSFVAISACALATIVLLCSSESLYSLPTFAPPLIAVAIVLLTIMAAVDGAGLDRPFFMKTWFLVSVITSLVLLVDFSIYLAQPSIFAQPTYATVDAYRDCLLYTSDAADE